MLKKLLKQIKKLKWLLAAVALAALFTGCEVTPYRNIIKLESGAEIRMQCVLVGKIPVMCAFFYETKVEVPVEVLVEVVVEKVVEIEKIVEIETVVEKITTEYVNTEIDAESFVQSVIAALPEGTTRQNYDYQEVVTTVEETILTYTPEPTTTTTETVTTTPKPTNPPPITTPDPTPPNTTPGPVVVDDTPKTIRVDGGNSDNLKPGEQTTLTIRTGEHDPFTCEGKHPSVTAYKDGVARDHQHWAVCETGSEIVVYLKNHPALTCAVGPNTHELEIDGLNERVIVQEGCE